MHLKSTFDRWILAAALAIIFIFASGVMNFLLAFFFLPVTFGGQPPESFPDFYPWWFITYWFALLGIVMYTMWCEGSIDPDRRRNHWEYIILLAMPLILWAGRDGMSELVLLLTLAITMALALFDAQTMRQKVTDLCQGSNQADISRS